MNSSIRSHPILAQNNSGILPIPSPYWIILSLPSTFEGGGYPKKPHLQYFEIANIAFQ